MIRGDFLRKGVEVVAGTPASLNPLGASPRAADRLTLAKWIVDPANPLTRRVLVNWVWQKYFGRGIVATPEDFGTQGERPSHPELLDWLAAQVLELMWSLKDLHRLIVTSATYRQSSKSRPELKDRDPLNVLLARQNRLRLEAEVVRDAALAVERPAECHGRRAERSAAATGGHLGADLCGQRQVGREHGRRPLSPRAVHLVPAHEPVPDADDLRRAGLRTSARSAASDRTRRCKR